MCFSSGFESILEGLIAPELLKDLKVFKGKFLFVSFVVLIMTVLFIVPSGTRAHFDSRQDSTIASRRENGLCYCKVGVLDEVGSHRDFVQYVMVLRQ